MNEYDLEVIVAQILFLLKIHFLNFISHSNHYIHSFIPLQDIDLVVHWQCPGLRIARPPKYSNIETEMNFFSPRISRPFSLLGRKVTGLFLYDHIMNYSLCWTAIVIDSLKKLCRMKCIFSNTSVFHLTLTDLWLFLRFNTNASVSNM